MLSSSLSRSPAGAPSEREDMDHLDLASCLLIEGAGVDVTDGTLHGTDELHYRLVVIDELGRRFCRRILALEPVALVVRIGHLEHLADEGRMGLAFLLNGPHLLARWPFLV